MIVINPGSGPVEGVTEQQAVDNLRHFITDLGPDFPRLDWLRYPRLDDGGRYGFLLFTYYRAEFNPCAMVEMPGIALEKVRFMKSPGQDIWEFPRLYVDKSSWLWFIALNAVRHVFVREVEDD